MSNELKILIDGTNFACRSAYTVHGLMINGKPVNVIYGFLRNYIAIVKKYGMQADYYIFWDAGYDSRLSLSEQAVKNGIITSSYKQNRRDRVKTEEEKLELKLFFEQLDILKTFLKYTSIKQLIRDGEEADDLIASFCEQKYLEAKKIIITSDKDYYQLLSNDKRIEIYDAIKKKEYNEDWFKRAYGIKPSQWVDVGAFVGDIGDNIIGCKGFGLKTTLPYIKEFGSFEAVLSYFKEIVSKYREQYPDIENIPYSGIRLALAEKRIKKLPFKKVILNALESEEIIRLAYKLKKMKFNLEIPDDWGNKPDIQKVRMFLTGYKFKSLLDCLHYFVLDDRDRSQKQQKIIFSDNIVKPIKLVNVEHPNLF